MQLDHVNIHAYDQEALRDFLVALLGLAVEPRPPFEVCAPLAAVMAGLDPATQPAAPQGARGIGSPGQARG